MLVELSNEFFKEGFLSVWGGSPLRGGVGEVAIANGEILVIVGSLHYLNFLLWVSGASASRLEPRFDIVPCQKG